MIKHKIYIASNIKVLRIILGISQDHFANEIGVLRARVGGWEEGRNRPPLEALVIIAKYFKIKLEDLLLTDLRQHL